MPEREHVVRADYDRVATQYAELSAASLATSALDRAELIAFAELVSVTEGPVADLGCGPGDYTAFLAGLGCSTIGIDLSPALIEIARSQHPTLRFEVGSMSALDFADASLAGAVLRYSIIHAPPHEVPQILEEVARVVRPGGYVLIAFQALDSQAPPLEFDHRASPAFRWWPDEMAGLLCEAGWREVGRMLQPPHEHNRFPGATLIAVREATTSAS